MRIHRKRIQCQIGYGIEVNPQQGTEAGLVHEYVLLPLSYQALSAQV